MGFNEKALYYCGTHTNTFLKRNCDHCGQGMCTTCLEKHPDFCPQCCIELNIGRLDKDIKKELVTMTAFGLVFLLCYYSYVRFVDPDLLSGVYYNLYLLVSFVCGVSVVGTYYLLKGATFYKDAIKIPFLGFKLTYLIPIVTFLSTVPFFYYLYSIVQAAIYLFRKKN